MSHEKHVVPTMRLRQLVVLRKGYLETEQYEVLQQWWEDAEYRPAHLEETPGEWRNIDKVYI